MLDSTARKLILLGYLLRAESNGKSLMASLKGCHCIRGWRTDAEESGGHNLEPVFCTEYIQALEEALTKCRSDGDAIVERVKLSMKEV